MKDLSAIVLLSGGMDSTISLFWALDQGYQVHSAISIDYGQRHSIELESAKKICQIAGIKQFTTPISVFAQAEDSALVDNTSDVVTDHHPSHPTLPASFVPGRNILFLTIAAVFAHRFQVKNIITGVCQTDSSGYPDTRANTIKALNVTLNLGMDSDFEIVTPLMYLTKAESILAIFTFEVINRCLKALSYTYTCYEGKVPPCMKCPACILRAKGFKEAHTHDPLLARLQREK
ncbi:hypothetical protein LCGC14_1482700 [marine sediment metagenome]|uniref:7-cyano-7-deazaguanine synthase n=1 Tax=marine sediment metagenome TaxID=412755 RepID=A0A0F9MAX9_9ZZZZ